MEKIICDSIACLSKYLDEVSVSLSIVYPPVLKDEKNAAEHVEFVQKAVELIADVTRPGGICCLILTDDTNKKGDAMFPIGQKIFLKIFDAHKKSYWHRAEEIMWIHGPESIAQKAGDKEFVSFDDVPFSHIHVLVMEGSGLEYVEKNERVMLLDESEPEKKKLFEPFWYVQPTSDSGFHDRLPKKIVQNIVRIFSKENDLVLDPFAGEGVVASVCRNLHRNFICFENDKEKAQKAERRIK